MRTPCKSVTMVAWKTGHNLKSRCASLFSAHSPNPYSRSSQKERKEALVTPIVSSLVILSPHPVWFWWQRECRSSWEECTSWSCSFVTFRWWHVPRKLSVPEVCSQKTQDTFVSCFVGSLVGLWNQKEDPKLIVTVSFNPQHISVLQCALVLCKRKADFHCLAKLFCATCSKFPEVFFFACIKFCASGHSIDNITQFLFGNICITTNESMVGDCIQLHMSLCCFENNDTTHCVALEQKPSIQ